MSELEKSVAERKHLLAQARQLLDKLVSDLAAARLELERMDGAVASSQSELKKLRERIVVVRRREEVVKRRGVRVSRHACQVRCVRMPVERGFRAASATKSCETSVASPAFRAREHSTS